MSGPLWSDTDQPVLVIDSTSGDGEWVDVVVEQPGCVTIEDPRLT